MSEGPGGRGLALADAGLALLLRGRSGSAPFIICATLFSLTLISVRVWWLQTRTERDARELATSRLLNAHSEPRRDSQLAALTSAAMHLPYVQRGFSCSSAEGRAADACSRQRALLEAFSYLASPRPGVGSRPPWARALGISSAGLAELRRGPGSPLPAELPRCGDVCSPDNQHAPRSSQQAARCRAYCLDDHPALLIPWFADPQADRAGLRLAQVMDGLMRSTVRFDAPTELSEPALVQAFLVTPTGIIGVWSEEQESTVALFGAELDLRGRDYMGQFMAADRPVEHETLPYVDEGGFGIVRTTCRGAVHEAQLRAVFCVDVAVPIHASPVDDTSALFQHALLRASTHAGAVEVHAATDLGQFDAEELLEVRTSLRREIDDAPSNASPRGALRQVLTRPRSVKSGTDEDPTGWSFLVPLRRRGDNVVLLLMRGRPYEHPPSLYIAVALIGASLLAASWAIAIRRVSRIELAQESVLRNLQVGAMRTDAENRIRMANDRAEELLGIALPGISGGMTDRERTPRLEEIFEEVGYRPRLGSQELEAIHIDEIELERSRGLTSKYFLRKRSPRLGLPMCDWLMLQGSPEVGPSSAALGSFGVLDHPSREELERIQQGEERRARRLGLGTVLRVGARPS